MMAGRLGCRHGIEADEREADQRAAGDHADLADGARHQRGCCGSDEGEAAALPVGAEVLRHADHGVGHDGGGGDLEPREPAAAEPRRVGMRHAIGEGEHDQRGGQGEGEPSRGHAQRAGAHQPDRHAHLAGGGTRQELAQRDEIGVGLLAQPLPAPHQLLAEIAEMRHRSAEGGEAELQEDAEHLARRAGIGGRGGFVGVCFGHDAPALARRHGRCMRIFDDGLRPPRRPRAWPARRAASRLGGGRQRRRRAPAAGRSRCPAAAAVPRPRRDGAIRTARRIPAWR